VATTLHDDALVRDVRRDPTALALIALLVCVGFSAPVHAYVDLGSGSYLLQLLLSGVFALLFVAKSLWGRVLAILKRSDGEKLQ
jgi:hypothetical protein